MCHLLILSAATTRRTATTHQATLKYNTLIDKLEPVRPTQTHRQAKPERDQRTVRVFSCLLPASLRRYREQTRHLLSRPGKWLRNALLQLLLLCGDLLQAEWRGTCWPAPPYWCFCHHL
jgi:hypothetical protein